MFCYRVHLQRMHLPLQVALVAKFPTIFQEFRWLFGWRPPSLLKRLATVSMSAQCQVDAGSIVLEGPFFVQESVGWCPSLSWAEDTENHLCPLETSDRVRQNWFKLVQKGVMAVHQCTGRQAQVLSGFFVANHLRMRLEHPRTTQMWARWSLVQLATFSVSGSLLILAPIWSKHLQRQEVHRTAYCTLLCCSCTTSTLQVFLIPDAPPILSVESGQCPPIDLHVRTWILSPTLLSRDPSRSERDSSGFGWRDFKIKPTATDWNDGLHEGMIAALNCECEHLQMRPPQFCTGIHHLDLFF